MVHVQLEGVAVFDLELVLALALVELRMLLEVMPGISQVSTNLTSALASTT